MAKKQDVARTIVGLRLVNVEIMEDGRWGISLVQEFDDKTEEPLLVVRSPDVVMYRCAEYGIDDQDQEALTWMVILEAFIPREYWLSEEFLFRASTIEKARKGYLRELAKVAKLFKKGAQGDAHLRRLREQFVVPPRDLAIRSLGVVLERHRNGAQVLDPDVARALTNFEKALDVTAKGN